MRASHCRDSCCRWDGSRPGWYSRPGSVADALAGQTALEAGGCCQEEACRRGQRHRGAVLGREAHCTAMGRAGAAAGPAARSPEEHPCEAAGDRPCAYPAAGQAAARTQQAVAASRTLRAEHTSARRRAAPLLLLPRAAGH